MKLIMRLIVISFFLMFLNIALSKTLSDEQLAVKNSFTQWTTDFNAKNLAGACDLFSQDLRWVTLYPAYTTTMVEKNYATICQILHRTLKDQSKQFHYDFKIDEIIVTGNLAVVRIVWTLTSTPKNKSHPKNITNEFSLDILRKHADNRWRIFRFMAYELPVSQR